MLKDYTFWGTHDLVKMAIKRIKNFCPPEGYWGAFSGGKDSVVLYYLTCAAGVKVDWHFNMTTVDPPEVLNFIREFYPTVEMHRPEESMWKLIVRKRMPPTRRVRYCCEALKERGGIGRVVLTGIRWEESHARKKRKMVESCYKHPGKVYVNPIIEWTEEDVWELIHSKKLLYCSLYDEGFERIGCVLCPMHRGRKADIERFPGFYKAYLRAFDKMLIARKEAGLKTVNWENGLDVMNWWLDDKKAKYDSNQILFSMFE